MTLAVTFLTTAAVAASQHKQYAQPKRIWIAGKRHAHAETHPV